MILCISVDGDIVIVIIIVFILAGNRPLLLSICVHVIPNKKIFVFIIFHSNVITSSASKTSSRIPLSFYSGM